MFIGSIRAPDGRWQIELHVRLLCCYCCFRLVVVVVFQCCCCSFVVVLVVRVNVSATVIVVLVVLSFGLRRRRCCSCACRCPLSVHNVVVVLGIVATLSKTKSSARVYWFLSSWRLQVFLSAFKVFDSDGNPCLVVSWTTGFTGSVCAELLFLRILSCNTVTQSFRDQLQRIAGGQCSPWGSLANEDTPREG